MKELKLWLSIIRPKTLFASICPVIAAFIIDQNIFIPLENNIIIFIITLLCAVCLQVLSNLINDYYDFKKGTDKAGRIGPQRALAEGLIDLNQIRHAIFFTIAISVFCGAFLVYQGGEKILAIGIAAIVFAWLYTATDYSLSYLGIADIFVFVFYGIIAVCGTHYLLTDECFFCRPKITYIGCTCGVISMMLLMINNLRDLEEDKQAGKKTIPVRFGKFTGEILTLIYALLTGLFSYWAFGFSITNIIVVPALMLCIEVKLAKGKQYNRCLMHASILNVLFVILIFAHYFIKDYL